MGGINLVESRIRITRYLQVAKKVEVSEIKGHFLDFETEAVGNETVKLSFQGLKSSCRVTLLNSIRPFGKAQ